MVSPSFLMFVMYIDISLLIYKDLEIEICEYSWVGSFLTCGCQFLLV